MKTSISNYLTKKDIQDISEGNVTYTEKEFEELTRAILRIILG